MSTPLTTTSYAILGLLALRSFTTYELTQQMERAVGRIWPRARSKVYEEPKKLVAHGLATARKEKVGRRPRTMYTITPKGRRALKTWLAGSGAEGPSMECEMFTKLLFADQGSRADALSTIDEARRWAVSEITAFAETARPYLEGGGAFPERAGRTNMIVGRFMLDFYDLVHRWSEWADEVVSGWPEDLSEAEQDLSLMKHVVERAAELQAAQRAREAGRPV